MRLVLTHAVQIDAGFDLGAPAADFADAFAIERREFRRRARRGFRARRGSRLRGSRCCRPVTPLKPIARLVCLGDFGAGLGVSGMSSVDAWMHTGLAAFQRLDRRRGLPPYLVVLGYRLLTAAFPARLFHGALAVARSSAAASGSSTKKWPRCFVTPARRPASSPEPK